MSLLPIMMWPNILTARPADILRGVAIMTRFGWQGKPGLSVIAGDQPPDLRSIERLQAPVLAPSAVWNDRGQEAACEIEVPSRVFQPTGLPRSILHPSSQRCNIGVDVRFGGVSS
jgi:hypothetical protein